MCLIRLVPWVCSLSTVIWRGIVGQKSQLRAQPGPPHLEAWATWYWDLFFEEHVWMEMKGVRWTLEWEEEQVCAGCVLTWRGSLGLNVMKYTLIHAQLKEKRVVSRYTAASGKGFTWEIMWWLGYWDMGHRFDPQVRKTADVKGACSGYWEDGSDGGGSFNNTEIRLSWKENVSEKEKLWNISKMYPLVQQMDA